MTGTEITAYEGGQLAEFGPQIMTPEAARELDRQLRACTKAVLRDGTDYGVIPHTNGQKVLFKPGAEKLMQWFGYAYSCERLEIDTDADGNRQGVTYRASIVKRFSDGRQSVIIATCDGYAGYDEDKFYQSAEQARARAKDREESNAERYDRQPNPRKWMSATEHRAPWNTVMKMAQKRAIVGAVINATAAGGLFTVEWDGDEMPADGGPSLYQQMLGEAGDITSKAAGNELWASAVRAANDGQLTPDQKTHIQNRIGKRVKELQRYIQVDVTDLTDPSPAQAAPHVPPAAGPAEDGNPARQQGAGEASVPPAEQAPDGRPSRGQRSAGGTAKDVTEAFAKLGIDAESDQLVIAATLLRLDDIPGKLTPEQRQFVLAILGRCDNLEELQALMADGEVTGE